MTSLPPLLAAESPFLAAAFGLAGTLIGGSIAGIVSIVLARQNRAAIDLAWFRESRSEVYDRFLANAQRMLIVCLRCKEDDPNGRHTEKNRQELELAYLSLFEVHATVQRLAERPVIDASRDLAYRVLELKEIIGDRSPNVGLQHFDDVVRLVRSARHGAIDKMRAELGSGGSARPADDYNPFLNTELADEWDSVRGGSTHEA